MMSTAAVRPIQSRYRWGICALLFFATVIAYVDRGVLAFLEKYLESIFGWRSVQYSYMTTGFQIAYGIGLLTAGRMTDRLGTRKGFSIAILIWSVAAMAPGAAVGTWTFGVAMFFLGLGEAEQLEKDVTHAEDKALRYDFGEGLLEIGLVLTSLYFISRSKLFPVVGIISAAVGTVLAILGWFA